MSHAFVRYYYDDAQHTNEVGECYSPCFEVGCEMVWGVRTSYYSVVEDSRFCVYGCDDPPCGYSPVPPGNEDDPDHKLNR